MAIGLAHPRAYSLPMKDAEKTELRRGWTTGACATAATKAALTFLFGGAEKARVQISLPRGQTPDFEIHSLKRGDGWAQASVIKDAGDDPDVTHGAEIMVTVREIDAPAGTVEFHAGEGVGTVTKGGLPIAVGEAAINPVPRKMMEEVVADCLAEFSRSSAISIEVSIPGGAEIAKKTWNPRLGIKGGLSILGTTGIVRPYSCAAWIASIHRGIDVARASGLSHVAGSTGSMSEDAVRKIYDFPDHAMLDMGDFAGGLLKYLARHPIERLTIAGGFAKMTKLAQGAIDLHSARSQVDFQQLADIAEGIGGDAARVAQANTALEALTLEPGLADLIAEKARAHALRLAPGIAIDLVVVGRDGQLLSHVK